MREALGDILRCPSCAAEGRLRLAVLERSPTEIDRGSLTCAACGHVVSIDEGIVDLLHDPPAVVRREAEGLERFAEEMRNDGWDRERILALPHELHGYWDLLRLAMDDLLERVELPAGARLLDVGANTCWASALFAERGLDVIALDIARTELQGLRTARWWMEDRGIHFERVLATMHRTGLASGSVDVVFCSQVLHHNTRRQLREALAELHRILRPGGMLIVLAEPLRFLTRWNLRHGADVAHYEGNENIYFYGQYLRAARRAGFDVSVIPPRHQAFTRYPLHLGLDSSALGSTKLYVQHMLRRTPLGRRLLLGWLMWFGPETVFSMVGRKAG